MLANQGEYTIQIPVLLVKTDSSPGPQPCRFEAKSGALVVSWQGPSGPAHRATPMA